jgi:uncharacterized membrane protein
VVKVLIPAGESRTTERKEHHDVKIWTRIPVAAFFMIEVEGLVIWLIVSSVRPSTAVDTTSRSSALEVPTDRFVRGEIDAETYRSMKATIEGGR